VPLHLKPSDAVFVVFRKKARKLTVDIPRSEETELALVKGPWELSFQSDRGAPAKITLGELTGWNENTDPGIKYFSGTATYSNTIKVPAGWIKQATKLYLELGNVKNLAEVIVNGKPLGIVWKTPFRVEVTGALKEGDNTLEVKVTNLCVNRLIGDQQPDAVRKFTYTTQAFYQADSPLLTSGLLGPVKILSLSKK
jgi:beta-galactosidase/beta-glucuronidase